MMTIWIEVTTPGPMGHTTVFDGQGFDDVLKALTETGEYVGAFIHGWAAETQKQIDALGQSQGKEGNDANQQG